MVSQERVFRVSVSETRVQVFDLSASALEAARDQGAVVYVGSRSAAWDLPKGRARFAKFMGDMVHNASVDPAA